MDHQDIENRSEFICEKRLKKLNPELHAFFSSSVFAIDHLLKKCELAFPFYTNHTLEHSEQVIRYCNYIIGEDNVQKLNEDEIYVLLMGACLHDVGMGILQRDFDLMKKDVEGLEQYVQEHPHLSIEEITREFHQEFSASFIRKYRDLFEIPSEDHLYCICQIVKGHRHHNLFNPEEYNPEYRMSNGNCVRLPYLSAVVKLADELDIARERNLLADYEGLVSGDDKNVAWNYRAHEVVKSLRFEEGKVIVFIEENIDDIMPEIVKRQGKVVETLNEYLKVIEYMKVFTSNIQKVEFIFEGTEDKSE